MAQGEAIEPQEGKIPQDALTILLDPRTLNEKIANQVCIEIIENYPEFRRCLVWNKKISDFVLDLLVQSQDEWILFDIAGRKRLPYALAQKLSKSRFTIVRKQIVWNDDTSFEVLKSMYPDRNNEINDYLRFRLGLVMPCIDDWIGLEEGEDGEFYPYRKGTNTYRNRYRVVKRWIKRICLPYMI